MSKPRTAHSSADLSVGDVVSYTDHWWLKADEENNMLSLCGTVRKGGGTCEHGQVLVWQCPPSVDLTQEFRSFEPGGQVL